MDSLRSRSSWLILIDVFVLFSIGVYFVSLRYMVIPDLLFHALYFSSILLTALIVLRSKSDGIRLAIILLWAVTLKLTLLLRSPFELPLSPNSLGQLALASAISSSGRLLGSELNGIYSGYAYFPLMQTFLAVFHDVSGIPLELMVNWAMPFLSLLVPVFAFLFLYRRIVGIQVSPFVSLYVLAAGPFFIYAESYAAQQAFATIFFAMSLVGFMRGTSTRSWAAIVIVSYVALSLSHALMPILVVLLLILATLFALVMRQTMANSMRASAVLFALISTWFLFVAVPYFASIFSESQQYLLSSSELNVLSPFRVGTPGWKATWILGLEYAGLFVYGGLVLAQVFLVARNGRTATLRTLVPWALSACLVMGFFSVGLWLGHVQSNPDLKWRAMTLFYLLTAPFFASAIGLLQPRQRGLASSSPDLHGTIARQLSGRRFKVPRFALGLLLLALAVTPSFYMFYAPETYSVSAPPSGGLDQRLPEDEWIAMSLFYKNSVAQKEYVYGTIRAQLLTSFYAGVFVYSPIFPLKDGSILISSWRLGSYIESGLNYTDVVKQLRDSNVYYSNGEVTISIVIGS